MPSFIRVGRHSGPKAGHTARGWQATRRGRRVVVRWGPIKILQVGLGQTKYVWLKRARLPRTKLYRTASVAAARTLYARLKSLKLTNSADHHGYEPLPRGVNIRSRRPAQRGRAS